MRQPSKMKKGKIQITRIKMMMSTCPALSLINTLLNKSQTDPVNSEISWKNKISTLPYMTILIEFKKSAKIAQIMVTKGKTITILFPFSSFKYLKMMTSVHSSKTPWQKPEKEKESWPLMSTKRRKHPSMLFSSTIKKLSESWRLNMRKFKVHNLSRWLPADGVLWMRVKSWPTTICLGKERKNTMILLKTTNVR